MTTDYRYTGQREEAGIGLYYYNARWYDPYLNRWIQPDSIVPNPLSPTDWNRYAYVRDNPMRFTDPSGYDVGCPGMDASACGQGSNLVFNTGGGSGGGTSGGNSNGEHSRRRLRTLANAQLLFLRLLQNPIHDPDAYVSSGIGGCNTLRDSCKYGIHPGVDIAAGGKKPPVFAAAPGTIAWLDEIDSFGNVVVVEHDVVGFAFFTVYAHLDQLPALKQEDRVDSNTQIGIMGQSGGQTSVHLHWEARTAAGIDLDSEAWQNHPFRGAYHEEYSGAFWSAPKNVGEFLTYWVDLGKLDWVGYAPDAFGYTD